MSETLHQQPRGDQHPATGPIKKGAQKNPGHLHQVLNLCLQTPSKVHRVQKFSLPVRIWSAWMITLHALKSDGWHFWSFIPLINSLWVLQNSPQNFSLDFTSSMDAPIPRLVEELAMLFWTIRRVRIEVRKWKVVELYQGVNEVLDTANVIASPCIHSIVRICLHASDHSSQQVFISILLAPTFIAGSCWRLH